MSMPLLSLIVFLPLLGGLVILFVPKRQDRAVRSIATAALVLTFLASLMALSQFTPGAGYQLTETHAWIPAVRIHYALGVDGISIVLVVLTTLLSLLACLASYNIAVRVKEYFVLYLLLVTGMLGTFLALDLFLFYVFWEIVLVPMYFLIGIWGGPRKEYAAIKFFLYTLAGSVLMLLSILFLYLNAHTFSIPELAGGAGSMLPLKIQQILFLK